MGKRTALAALLLATAAAAALLAADLRSWRTAISRGDVQFARIPAAASWRADTLLPFHAARSILGISDQVALRSAEQQFVHLRAIGNGIDNGFTESQQRGALEQVMTRLSTGPDKARDSDAELMLGILAFADTRSRGTSAPAPVVQAVADFQAAVTDDPTNTNAKYDLELLLRYLVAKGTRTGSTNAAGGPAKGHKGAGGGAPGTGY
jgi:hypothetical protein